MVYLNAHYSVLYGLRSLLAFYNNDLKVKHKT